MQGIITVDHIRDCGMGKTALRHFKNNFPDGLDISKVRIKGDCFLTRLPKLVRCPEGRVIERFHQDGAVDHISYDKRGNVITESFNNGDEVYKYTYDNNNRKRTLSFYYHGDLCYKLTYDKRGNVIIKESPRMGTFTLQYVYDKHDNIIEKKTPTGEIITFEYDHNNLLKTESYQDGRVFGYVHDSRGNLIKYTWPLGNITVYMYDSFNNMIGRITSDDVLIEFHYKRDSKCRLIETPDYSIEYLDE